MKAIDKLMKGKEDRMKKETWKLVINMLISVLTAIATTLGLTSCM